MKFFVAFVALVAVAVANPLHKPNEASLAELEAIIAAIQSPSTDPGTAALLEQQLQDILASLNPEDIVVGPAIVDNYEPISVGPAIVDSYEPISVGPAIVDSYEPISVGPAIVDNLVPAVVDEASPAASSALIKIIINIAGSNFGVNPVVIEETPGFVDRPMPIPGQIPEVIIPEPVIVAPEPEPVIIPDPVVVAPEPVPVIVPEPVLVSPIFPSPVIAPEELN